MYHTIIKSVRLVGATQSFRGILFCAWRRQLSSRPEPPMEHSPALRLLLALIITVASLPHASSVPNVTHQAGTCIWKGECAPSPYVAGGMYDCFYNGNATKLEEGTRLYEVISETCPRLLNRSEVCCDLSIALTLQDQIKQARQLFSRCPACVKNFVNHFCIVSCDPDQSLFMDVPSSAFAQLNETSPWYITEVDVYITMEYANNLYNSCKSVQYPQDSGKVISLMCGGTGTCNPVQWLTFLGNPLLNHVSPFQISYFFSDTVPHHPEMIPQNASTADFYACNDTRDGVTCSCSDCPATCPPIPKFPVSHFPLLIVETSIAAVGASMSIVVFFIALCLALVYPVRKPGYVPISPGDRQPSKYGTVEDEEKKYQDNESPTSSIGSINSDDIPTKIDKSASSSVCYCYAKIGHVLENRIKKVFYHWGWFAAKYWYLVIFFVLLISAALSFGMFFFDVTTNPVDLWSSPTSRARQEKDYFDQHFNPFFRTEQIIITAPNESAFSFVSATGSGQNWTFGPVFNREVLIEVLELQNYLTNMAVLYTDDGGSEHNITLSDICFKPENDYCTIESVVNYFQNSMDNLNYTELQIYNSSYHIHYCTRNPTDPKADPSFNLRQIPCLAQYGGFVDPNVALGGFKNDEDGNGYNYDTSTALLVTFLVNNHVDKDANKMAETWEKAFLDYLHQYKPRHIDITFSAERAIEDEINRESRTDVFTIGASYLIMFIYITFFLGHIRSLATFFVDLKILVGLFGVVMVLVAVLAALGLLSYIGIMGSLIIIEVVPFLVLAVGVDNLFIMVHSYERQLKKFANRHEGNLQQVPIPEIIGRALGEVAPSLLLTSLSETSAFLLGGVSSMPAVRSFSFYAGTAVFFNFLLQVTAFVSVLSLDARRQMENRLDVAVCVRLKDKFDPHIGRDFLFLAMKYFARAVLNRCVRPFVVLVYGFTLTAALALVFRVQIGLSQTIALPTDSYLNPYFSDMNKYLHVGPPVYFVITEGFNYSDSHNQNKICSAAGCDGDSMGTQIAIYSRLEDVTRIAEPAMLWLDTYFEWIAPASDCCGYNNETHDKCKIGSNTSCIQCLPNEEVRPNPMEFETYLAWFLNDNPTQSCAAGGRAAFSPAVKLNKDNRTVNTSYVMTYHTILKDSNDYIEALRRARELGANLSHVLNQTVFPYSVFYVYYEQYLTTIHDMALNLGLSLGAVFLVSILLLGLNIWAAIIVLATVGSIIVHMLGSMGVLGINANAVSLVNLVMTVGIAVEFCSHIVRWFCSSTLPTRYERALSALSNMGASVFSGITMTKFLGVLLLVFAKSRIFEIYYFRMYMCMLVWGAVHGLIYLPVLLSYLGPPSYPVSVKSPYSDDYIHVRPSHPAPSPPTNVTPPSQPRPSVQPQHPQPTTMHQQVYPNLPESDGEGIPPYTGGQYPAPTYPREVVVDERTRLINQ